MSYLMNIQIAKESHFRLALFLDIGTVTMSKHSKDCKAFVLVAYLCLCWSPKATKSTYHYCSNIILSAYLITTLHSADSKIKSLQICMPKCFFNDELFIYLQVTRSELAIGLVGKSSLENGAGWTIGWLIWTNPSRGNQVGEFIKFSSAVVHESKL